MFFPILEVLLQPGPCQQRNVRESGRLRSSCRQGFAIIAGPWINSKATFVTTLLIPGMCRVQASCSFAGQSSTLSSGASRASSALERVTQLRISYLYLLRVCERARVRACACIWLFTPGACMSACTA